MKKTNHRRVLKIGNQLVHGPSAIFRISRGDWLEKDLQIVLYEPGMKRIESYSIWSDDSMNKEKDFLPPMIRILTWNRREDLHSLKESSKRKFPKIDLTLGIISAGRLEEINSKFITLQCAVLKNHNYVPYKIPMERDSADIGVNYEKGYLDFSIFFRNGEQALEFTSTGNLSAPLVQELITMKKLLHSSIEVVDKTNWKERYYELTEEYLSGEIPEWYYQDKMGK